MSFAREGLPFIVGSAIIAAAAYLLAIERRSWPLWLLAFVLTLVALWVAYFFRDPARVGERANEKFLKAFHQRFGDAAHANWFCVNSYMQVQLFAAAAERAGSVEVDDVSRVIGTGEVEAPLGIARVDPESNYTYCTSRLGIANSRGRFEIVYEAPETVRPDPFLLAYA